MNLSEDQEICRLYRSGLRGPKIKEKLNLPTIDRVYRALIRNGIKRKQGCTRTYSCDEAYFDRIDSHEKAQILGFIAADGCVFNNNLTITLSKIDIDYLTNIKKSLRYDGPLYHRTNDIGSYVTLNVSRKRYKEQLARYNIIRNKTFILLPPTGVDLPLGYQSSYLRGYFEGDGCISLSRNGCIYEATFSLCGTKEMMLFFGSLIRESTGVDASLSYTKSQKDRGNNNYILSVGGNKQVIRVMRWMYENASFVMQRKLDKLRLLESCYDKNLRLIRNNFGNRKEFIIKSPEGIVFEVKNLGAFAREYGLQPAHVLGVLKGKLKHHGRWTAATAGEIAEARATNMIVEKSYL